MSGLNAVDDGVEKASKVSKRQGKWANIPEITTKTHPVQKNMRGLLSQLVKDSRIEKKTGMLLYRPNRGGGGGMGGSSDGYRSPPPYDSGRPTYTMRPTGDEGGKTSDYPEDKREYTERVQREAAARRRKAERARKSTRRSTRRSSSKRNLTRTVARGVGTQAVASGIGQSVARQTITKSILM